MAHIFLDAMGGDNAPESTVHGALEALRENKTLRITLAGVEDAIRPLLKDCDDVMDRITVLHTPDVITNHDAPVMAVRQKKQSAIVMGMLALKEKQVDGFVSSGSTGAVLAGGIFRLGRLDGVDRPALAPLLPNGKDFFCLIDCGANVDCLPAYLPQFGVMGSAYMQMMRGIESPRVGLVNIGAEDEKGNALSKEAFPLMKKAPFHFIGNVEGRDITADVADVVVTDGFCGNLILKFMEGVSSTLLGMIKREMMADTRSKIGALLAKPAFRRVKKAMNYEEVGGAPLLGVKGVVVKAHGSSNAHAIACAIRQAVTMYEKNLPENIQQGINKLLSQSEQ